MKLDDIELCQRTMCDKGRIISNRVAESGKFELDDCPDCKGRGFLLKKRTPGSKSHG